ncbi:MAG: hypothetical protein QOE35_3771, partial [Actinomycetota bacterium]
AGLERGEATSGGDARRMSLGEFVARVAALEGVGEEHATLHAEAVLAALREAVSEKELADLTAQLPGEYAVLFERPSPVTGAAARSGCRAAATPSRPGRSRAPARRRPSRR